MFTRVCLSLLSLLIFLVMHPPGAVGQFGGDSFSAGDSPGYRTRRQGGITIYSKDTDPPEIHCRHARAPYTPDYGVFIPYPEPGPYSGRVPVYTRDGTFFSPCTPRPPNGWPVGRPPSQIPDPDHLGEALPDPAVDLIVPAIVAPGIVGGWRWIGASAAARQFTQETVRAKVRNYLFNPGSPRGWDKGQWFVKALGYEPSNPEHWAMLERQIYYDPAKAMFQEMTKWGPRFEQLTKITGPNGRTIDGVRAIWQKDAGTSIIRLINIIPPK